MNTKSAQGSAENFTEAPWLDALLREDAECQEDLRNGDFTRQVLARLPASHRTRWSWIAPVMGAVTALILLFVMPVQQIAMLVNTVAGKVTPWLIGALPEMLLPALVLALAVAAAGILMLPKEI